MNTPEELKAIEAMLMGMQPGSGAIDRDRLMFEAGWAAAEEAHGWSSASTINPRRKRGAAGWHWHLASAMRKHPLATAASLAAVALGLMFLGRFVPQSADQSHQAAPNQIGVIAPAALASGATSSAADLGPFAWTPSAWTLPDGYFGFRNRLLAQAAMGAPLDPDRRDQTTPSSSAALDDPQPTDSRTLLKQLLDDSSGRKSSRPADAHLHQG